MLQNKLNQVIPLAEAVFFKNEFGAVEQGKLIFYPIHKIYLIDTIATVDRYQFKDTRFNIVFFLISFSLFLASFADVLAAYSVLFRVLGFIFFLCVLFYKKKRYMLTIIFEHRKAISFYVTKEQFFLSSPLLRAINQYQNAKFRFSSKTI